MLQPMADVMRIAREAGALVHCDAVQAAGKVPVDLHGIGIDYPASPPTSSAGRPGSAR